MTEMQDDEILVPPLELSLVKKNFWPFDEPEKEMFFEACREGRLEEVETSLQKPLIPMLQ